MRYRAGSAPIATPGGSFWIVMPGGISTGCGRGGFNCGALKGVCFVIGRSRVVMI